MRLDSGVIMASSTVRGNYCSCVHIKLETGYGLYVDSIEREVPRDFEDTFRNFFQAVCKVYEEKKNIWLLNPCKLFMKYNQQIVRTNVDIFV